MKSRLLMAGAMLVLSPVAALAGHGKAGLWNIATTMQVTMSPAVQAQMKKAGVKLPGASTYTSQICMTQAQVDSNAPPHVGRNDAGCTSHVISLNAGAMASDMVCNGKVKGKGRIAVTYAGPEHYHGTYSFHGGIQGHPSDLHSSFKGDWVKTDCGAVKPFIEH